MTKVAYNNAYGGFMLRKEVIDYLKEHGMPINDCDCLESPDGSWHNINYVIERHNPLLIEALEKFPDDEISIAEISGDRYWIWEYDGLEHVYTPETIPWVIINKEGLECS